MMVSTGRVSGESWSVPTVSAPELASDHGLRFCIEPRVGETFATTDAMLRLIDHVDTENLGVVLDAAHLYAAKEILPLSVEKLGDRVYYVHAADNDSKDNRHLAVGDGHHRLGRFVVGFDKNGVRRLRGAGHR